LGRGAVVAREPTPQAVEATAVARRQLDAGFITGAWLPVCGGDVLPAI